MSFIAEPIKTIPSLCLVIPMWNKQNETLSLSQAAIQSVFDNVDRTQVDLRLVVVDNASPVPCYARSNDRFDLLMLSKNRGFGPAVNLGAQVHSDTDYVGQMNSDCALVEDSVNLLIGAMEKYDLDVGMPEHYDNCRHYGLEKSDEVMGSDWRFGAFWIARRAAWDAVGGFDEAFEMCYWEDTDLWKSIESTGRKIAGWRGTWVKHVGGASSHPRRDEFFAKNKALFEEKWGK